MHYARGDTIVRVKNETMSKIGCYFSKMCTYHKEKKRKKWSNCHHSQLSQDRYSMTIEPVKCYRRIQLGIYK